MVDSYVYCLNAVWDHAFILEINKQVNAYRHVCGVCQEGFSSSIGCDECDCSVSLSCLDPKQAVSQRLQTGWQDESVCGHVRVIACACMCVWLHLYVCLHYSVCDCVCVPCSVSCPAHRWWSSYLRPRPGKASQHCLSPQLPIPTMTALHPCHLQPLRKLCLSIMLTHFLTIKNYRAKETSLKHWHHMHNPGKSVTKMLPSACLVK